MRHLEFKKTCEWCGKQYTARTIATRFCCHTCSNNANKAKKRQKVMADFAAANPTSNLRQDPVGNLDVMNPSMAARYLGISRATMYRYIESGQVKALRLASKTLIRKTDLDALFVFHPSALVPPQQKAGTQEVEYYTARQIMELLGLSMSSVCRLVQKAKVPSVKHRGLTYYEKSYIDRIKRKRDNDPYPDIKEWYTTNEIAERYGKSPETIYSLVYVNGIPKKKVDDSTSETLSSAWMSWRMEVRPYRIRTLLGPDGIWPDRDERRLSSWECDRQTAFSKTSSFSNYASPDLRTFGELKSQREAATSGIRAGAPGILSKMLS